MQKSYIIGPSIMDMINGKALCIGINKFMNFPENNLRGCVNDVDNISKVLIDMGIPSENIYKLVDEQATKANIINGIRYLVNEAIKGNCSYVFLSLSSHGTRIPSIINPNSDVAAYVPTDVAASNSGWVPDSILSADEISDLISTIPSNIVFEAVIDSCHSGGNGIRDFDLQPNIKVRYLAPPVPPQVLSRGITQVRNLKDVLPAQHIDNHISWTACRSDQTAADAFIGGSFNGAFSHSLCSNLRSSENRLDRSSLLVHVQNTLVQSFTQIPELHCSPKQSSHSFGTVLQSGLGRVADQSTPFSDMSPQNMIPLIQILWIIYKNIISPPKSLFSVTPIRSMKEVAEGESPKDLTKEVAEGESPKDKKMKNTA
jgi:hypothetical protein